MRFLLDTNVLEHLANRASGWERIRSKIDNVGVSQCAISAITAYELRQHIERGPGRVRLENIERLKAIYASIDCIDLDLETADLAGRIAAALADSGISIGLHDPLIAATALKHELTCVTDNTRHFIRVPRLQVVNWRV